MVWHCIIKIHDVSLYLCGRSEPIWQRQRHAPIWTFQKVYSNITWNVDFTKLNALSDCADSGEGQRPIFDREEVVVNQEFGEREVSIVPPSERGISTRNNVAALEERATEKNPYRVVASTSTCERSNKKYDVSNDCKSTTTKEESKHARCVTRPRDSSEDELREREYKKKYKRRRLNVHKCTYKCEDEGCSWRKRRPRKKCGTDAKACYERHYMSEETHSNFHHGEKCTKYYGHRSHREHNHCTKAHFVHDRHELYNYYPSYEYCGYHSSPEVRYSSHHNVSLWRFLRILKNSFFRW